MAFSVTHPLAVNVCETDRLILKENQLAHLVSLFNAHTETQTKRPSTTWIQSVKTRGRKRAG